MKSIKTAISLHENIFKQVDQLAGELHVSRSRLFVLAMEEFIKKNENKKLLARINTVYDENFTEDEKKISNAMKTKHRKDIESEPW